MWGRMATGGCTDDTHYSQTRWHVSHTHRQTHNNNNSHTHTYKKEKNDPPLGCRCCPPPLLLCTKIHPLVRCTFYLCIAGTLEKHEKKERKRTADIRSSSIWCVPLFVVCVCGISLGTVSLWLHVVHSLLSPNHHPLGTVTSRDGHDTHTDKTGRLVSDNKGVEVATGYGFILKCHVDCHRLVLPAYEPDSPAGTNEDRGWCRSRHRRPSPNLWRPWPAGTDIHGWCRSAR